MVLRWVRRGGEGSGLSSLRSRDHICGQATPRSFSPPPCPGLLPYSLAFLLFWFNKTKSGAWHSGGREGGQQELPGHTLITTTNHHPRSERQAHPRSPHFKASTLSLCSLLALPSPVFLGSGGMREIGSQM